LGLPHDARHDTPQQQQQQTADSDSVVMMAPVRNKSRNTSANGRLTAQDFNFGATIGEGSYSTVRIILSLTIPVFTVVVFV
jgi:hypothetical protein